MTPHVLLFDLDGTLIDSKPGIVRCVRFALDQLRTPCPSEEVLASYIGPPLRGTFARLLDTDQVDRVEEAMRLYRQRFAETGLYENQIYEGIPAMLERATQAAAYIATSKPAVYAERIVERSGLDQYFRKVYGPELDGTYDDKAELVTHLLAAEGVPPIAAVLIGDRAADVRAARLNGMRSIGVLWGYGSERELVEAGANVLCRTPLELAGYLAAGIT